jgi:hypothetical protein
MVVVTTAERQAALAVQAVVVVILQLLPVLQHQDKEILADAVMLMAHQVVVVVQVLQVEMQDLLQAIKAQAEMVQPLIHLGD